MQLVQCARNILEIADKLFYLSRLQSISTMENEMFKIHDELTLNRDYAAVRFFVVWIQL